MYVLGGKGVGISGHIMMTNPGQSGIEADALAESTVHTIF